MFKLIASNSDNTVREWEFPTLEAAANAGRRVDFLGGCPLSIRSGSDEFFADRKADGTLIFVISNEPGLRLYA